MSASMRFRFVWSRLLLVAVLPLGAACKSDSLKPEPVPEPSDVYWDLVLDKHAVTMSTTAPYDTVTLFAMPRNYHGERLDGLPPVQFVSTDPSVVSVTPEGVLVAQSASDALVPVVATLTAGNLKHADTVAVRVVDDPAPPVLETFSIQPVPPDSAKWAAGPDHSVDDAGYARLLNPLVRVTYAGGAPVPTISMYSPDFFSSFVVPDILVSFRSSDTTVARFVRSYEGDATDGHVGVVKQLLLGVRHGSVDLYASATVFGVTKADTLHFRVGYPLAQVVNLEPVTPGAPVNYFREPAIVLGTGGVVNWVNTTDNSTEVTFTDPTNVRPFNGTVSAFFPPDVISAYCFILQYYGSDCTVGGNFVSLPKGATVSGSESLNFRLFSVPGIYEYHSAEGRTARIDVRSD